MCWFFGSAAVPVILLSGPETFYCPWGHWIVLNRTQWASDRPWHVAMTCVFLELPGWHHSFFEYFTSFSGFCTCSRVKFQNTGGAHCPRYLPILSYTPCYSWLSSLRAFLNICSTLNKIWNTFRRHYNRNIPRIFNILKSCYSQPGEGEGERVGKSVSPHLPQRLVIQGEKLKSVIINSFQEMAPEVQTWWHCWVEIPG